MKQLKHENIVEAKEFFNENGKINIVMEFIPFGSLKELLNEKKTVTGIFFLEVS